MADIRDKSFLALCVTRGLINQVHADRLYQQALVEDRRCTDLVAELGLIARHTVEALLAELKAQGEPRLIGGYRLLRRLGQGGMATVFLAEQVSLGRQVALKLLSPRIINEPEAVERFVREARLASTITHPHVIGIIDVGQHEGQPYMVLELVTGGDAARLARGIGGSLPEARALELIHDCTQGLAALHAARLLHRDIKPSNIFIDANGRAKLADLGLARSESGDDRVTTTGLTVGTPAFMSPEQARADPTLDIRGDIYALAASLYALVTGQPPYTGTSPLAVLAKVLTNPPLDPLLLRPTLSAGTVALLTRNLAKDPAARCQNPAEFLRELAAAQTALHAPSTVTTAPTPVPAVRVDTRVATRAGGGEARGPGQTPPARAPHRPLAAGAVGLGVLACLAWLVWGRAAPQRPAPSPEAHGPAAPAAAAASAPGMVPALASAAPAAPWAVAHGSDAHGAWADLRIDQVVQRLRWLPPARLTIGSPPTEPTPGGFEKPSLVTFRRGFWIADTECTQAFWQAVMGDNPAQERDPRKPVESVSLLDILGFTARLRQRQAGLVARLPSRAEWEYACRGGTSTRYWCGDDPALLWRVANVGDWRRLQPGPGGGPFTGDDGFATLAPVASFPANPFGLYDCHGNVSELCLGRNSPLPATATDPECDEGDPQSGLLHGGNYSCPPDNVRSGSLPFTPIQGRVADVGFRFLVEGPR